MGIDIWNLNARLSTPNCKCCFFGGATPKKPLYSAKLNEANVMTDIAVLHMGTNGINNVQVDKDHIAKCVIDIAKECVWFVVKDVFASSTTVKNQGSSALISW